MKYLFGSILLFFILFGLVKIIESLFEISKTVMDSKKESKSSFLDFATNKNYFIFNLIAVIIFCFFISPLIIHNTQLFNFFINEETISKNNSNDKEENNTNTINKMKANEIGDAFGGTVSPIITFIGIILTFLAFYIQYKANKEQREQFTQSLTNQKLDTIKQDKTWRIERFESRFYELLRLHKENLSEIKIKNNTLNGIEVIEARNVFVLMFNEFRYTFWICKDEYDTWKSNKDNIEIYSDEQLVRLAYIFFYVGVQSDNQHVSKSLNQQNAKTKFNAGLFDRVRKKLEWIKYNFLNAQKYIDHIGNQVLPNGVNELWNGHQSKLGHYYRHLFQTVKYVVDQPSDVIEDKNYAKSYLTTLRAQLSDHEQLLLYYNAIAEFGKKWITLNYFTDYNMIHNIPIPLANFGISPEVKFPQEDNEIGNSLFEWSSTRI